VIKNIRIIEILSTIFVYPIVDFLLIAAYPKITGGGVLLTTNINECFTMEDDSRLNTVQVWFRAPKIWDDFLETKAAAEYCTKSDLLRHAFRQVFGQEIKQFRANGRGKSNCAGCPAKEKRRVEMGSIITQAVAAIPIDLQGDPWVESMAAFVANKGSYETRRVYRIILSQFFAFVSKHPSNVKQSDVIRYRHELEKRGKAPSTIRQHLAAISGYYSFCISRDLSVYNPTKGVTRPPVDAYAGASWLNPVQAKHFISKPDRTTVKGKRDYAILLTLLLTGLRRKELANVFKEDIQEKDGKVYMTYTCKGGVRISRDVPRRCWEAIQDYLAASGRKITDESPLFTAISEAGETARNGNGNNGNGHHPITPEAIRQMVIYYSQQAFGDEIKVRPHTLRHTAGTLLRKSGCSVEEVQTFLNHKRLDTTRRYLHVVEADNSEFGECIAKMLDL
jgi:site-specific recombinase XerD